MSTVIEYYPGYSQVQVRENLLVETIASITNSNPMVLTTVSDSGYVAGMKVSFLITPQFGMTQLNSKIAQVLAVNGTQITLGIDSTSFTPFAYPSPLPNAYTVPSIIPYSSGPYLPPLPLPYGNQNSFEGTIYNDGQV
jgi:hypothetical protein